MENLFRAAAQVYDIVYETKPPMPDIAFYLDYAKQQQGEVLELGCGTGRVALRLAEAGFRVTGLDLSTQMLDIFKQKLTAAMELAEKITLVHGNMADFSLDRKYAMIISPFRAFQALTDDRDIEKSLSCICEHLTDSGIFIVNVFYPYADPLDESWCREEVFIDEIINEQTGIRIKRYECRERIDTANQIIYPYLVYEVSTPEGKTERLTEPLRLKYYYSRQLRAFIEKAGMEITEEYSWYDKSPPGSREIIFVCRRKKL